MKVAQRCCLVAHDIFRQGQSGREKAACRNRPWPFYSDWEVMYQGRTATGAAVIRPRRPTNNKRPRQKEGDSSDEDEDEGEDDDEDKEGEQSSYLKRSKTKS